MNHIVRKSFFELFENGNCPIGTILQLPSEELVEILGYAGMDYIILDMEHCPSSHAKIVSLIRAAEAVGLVPLVRVPCAEDEDSIKKALDAGAAGLLVPNISTPEQAALAVRYSHFAPEGNRGACPYVRANWFGAEDKSSFYERSNARTFLALLVEGEEGVKNIDNIIRVPGIDAVSIGSVDLAVSLGIPGQVGHPKILETVKNVAAMAADNGVMMSHLCMTVEEAQMVMRWRGMGFLMSTIPEAVILEYYDKLIAGMKKTKERK